MPILLFQELSFPVDLNVQFLDLLLKFGPGIDKLLVLLVQPGT